MMKNAEIVKHPTNEYLYGIRASKENKIFFYFDFIDQVWVAFDGASCTEKGVGRFYAASPVVLNAFNRMQEAYYLENPETVNINEMKAAPKEKPSIFDIPAVVIFFIALLCATIATGAVTIFKTIIGFL